MNDQVVYSRRRVLGIFFVAAVLGILVVWQLLQPLRLRLSERYTVRGDVYLVAQEFDTAQQEYAKALRYDHQNPQAKAHLVLAQKAPVDIAAARDFYTEHDVQSVLQKLAIAQKKYTTAKEAVQVGMNFYDTHDFVYARYPLEWAVQLDPEYPVAWHYLGLTYRELATWDPTFQSKADAAFKKRDALTPQYLL